MKLTCYPPPWPQRRMLDAIVRRYTACRSFAELVENPHGYRPTLRAWIKSWFRVDTLALAYDQAQTLRGDPRRAWPERAHGQ